MIDPRRHQVPTWLLVALALGAAAGFAATAAAAHASSSPATTISSRHTKKAGVILVGPRGQTLYLFSSDRNGMSSCYGSCARGWPPLRASGRPIAIRGSRVKQRWLSTTRRRDGIVQVTYDGYPLYVNGGHTQPGSLVGDSAHEFGGRWYAVPINGPEHTAVPK